MARLIKTDGLDQELPKKKYTFDELKEIMGISEDSLIQLVDLGDDCLACDEEGKIKGLPRNEVATSMAHLKGAILRDDYFVGNVVILSYDEID